MQRAAKAAAFPLPSYSGRHIAPVFSTMNIAGNLAAMLFPLAVPWLVETGGWNQVLFVFAGIHLAAAFCWLRLDPEGTIFDRCRPDIPR